MSFVVSYDSNGFYYVGDSTHQYGCGFVDGCYVAPEKLVIPSTIDNKKVTQIGQNAFYSCDNIKELEISEGYEKTQSYCFCKCLKLTKVILPISLKILGSSSFEDCYVLTTIVFPKNTKLRIIYGFCFNQCLMLKNITIPPSVRTVNGDLFSLITNHIVIYSYYRYENYDDTIFRGTENVTIYVPLNGPKYFGNRPTIPLMFFPDPYTCCCKLTSRIVNYFTVFLTILYLS